MLTRLTASCLSILACAAPTAFAERVADGGTVKVSFSLTSDTYELEYLHPGTDGVAATDNAFYRAAQFMLRMGHAEFHVEDVNLYGIDAETRPDTAQVMVCGNFGCAEGMKQARLEQANVKPVLGQTLVSISLASPQAAAGRDMPKINSGRVIYAMEGVATYADAGGTTAAR
jgi:hypothetical protein